MRTEFENYKKEMAEKINEAAINEAAAQNLSLQDQIDDLQELLKHVAKAQHASVPKASVQNAEPAATASVPLATPRASDAQAAKGSDEPIQELKTPAVLAQEAKAKLDELLKGGSSQQKPAVGNDQPQLPTQSGFFTPTEAIKTPPNDSPKSATKQQQVMGPSDLIELVKALTQREEKDKPKN